LSPFISLMLPRFHSHFLFPERNSRRQKRGFKVVHVKLSRTAPGSRPREPAHTREFRELLLRMPKIADCVAEGVEFELSSDFLNGQ
jgi:hypothetical protein